MYSFRSQGHNVVVYPGAKILCPERISVGSNVIVDDFVFLGAHRELLLGSYVHIAAHASVTGGGQCIVCDFAGISSGARIITGTDDFTGGGLTGPTVPAEFRRVSRGAVVLGAHVIVGANAVVLPNVTIGEGATIGAGSVVTRNLEPWTVYAGVPARPIKPRDKETILRHEHELYAKHGRLERPLRYPPVGSDAAALHPPDHAAA